jgi:mono/diheme cytochrome c family protein
MRGLLLGPIVAGLAVGGAWAAPRTYVLPDPTAELKQPEGGEKSPLAPGYEAAQANCQTCHAVDYIATQPPGRGKAFWEAEVTKMMKAYHAPIAETDARAIAAYLAGTY